MSTPDVTAVCDGHVYGLSLGERRHVRGAVYAQCVVLRDGEPIGTDVVMFKEECGETIRALYNAERTFLNEDICVALDEALFEAFVEGAAPARGAA